MGGLNLFNLDGGTVLLSTEGTDLVRCVVVALPLGLTRLALGSGAACGLGGRDPVLQLQTPAGPITYTVGSPPSAIWRRRVLMRCGPAFGLDGEPSAGAAQNRVLLDGLALPGLEAAVEPDGLVHLRLRQEFAPSGGGTQRIETEVRVLAGG